ncbi:SNF2 family N-terminal domain-containing protein [Pseudoneurospora amorphoporcata]|uniref:SNF2 family N-terminal domain-containing protein n=2 Tax=Sordariaceae TaxID=5148 RepID=A0AAN6SBW5_9PEZI|nr:SNF2 family N-terminal domain-containing protein [Pseudoneurospora amorphoporcata]
MLDRENESLSDNGSLHDTYLSHSIQLKPNYGGLIADVMGMGKTLSTLVTILHTLGSARDFADFTFSQAAQETPTRATLVVVPSRQLIDNWQFEIERHMCGALHATMFHGEQKPREYKSLMDTDLVLTTYSTLAADYKKSDLLHKMEWYRVVLDEAHEIRNSSTHYFRAASTLNTSRRWCLTGTPIQNKLEDLSSLAEFLRLPPYSAKNTFRKHVLEPLSSGGMCDSQPLRAYLRRYCLRRTDKCLDLPQSTATTIYQTLSDQEQKLYDAILSRAKWALDDIVSGNDKGTLKLYNVLFTATLKMRMVCNHGTLSPPWASTGFLTPQDGEINASCERCSPLDEGCEDIQFCPDCRRPLRANSLSVSAGSPNPTCLLGDGIIDAIDLHGSLQTDLFSTKLKAVRKQVFEAGAGTKHLIFSQWIPTLYGLVHIFRDAGVSTLLVHGKTSTSERTRLIKTFQEDPQASVLIMSVGTGAVGLNLTAASHVHVVEPHWNPSVEAQAIARAIRMGQTKNVIVTRYIMKGTVEENIVALQTKKQTLAKLTFDTGDGVNENLEDFKTVLGVKLD